MKQNDGDDNNDTTTHQNYYCDSCLGDVVLPGRRTAASLYDNDSCSIVSLLLFNMSQQ